MDEYRHMTDLERAYFAGLFDGEGSVSFYVKPTGYVAWQLVFTNTNQETIQLAHEWFGGSTRYKTVTCMTHSVGGSEAQRMAEILIPYSIIKRPQLELFLETRMLFAGGRGGTRLLPEEIARRHSYREKFKVLNTPPMLRLAATIN